MQFMAKLANKEKIKEQCFCRTTTTVAVAASSRRGRQRDAGEARDGGRPSPETGEDLGGISELRRGLEMTGGDVGGLQTYLETTRTKTATRDRSGSRVELLEAVQSSGED